MEGRVIEAATEYVLRGRRRRHPRGKFDSAGRWYPAPEEERECCRWVRPPSRRWPYSLLVHCRTAEHVARLYGVDPRDLRQVAAQVKALLALEREW